MCYRAAKDKHIAIHGKKELHGYTPEGSRIRIDAQIVDVKKALRSVRRMCEAGNRVVFDEEESYVENKLIGGRYRIDQGKWCICADSMGTEERERRIAITALPRQGMIVWRKLNP